MRGVRPLCQTLVDSNSTVGKRDVDSCKGPEHVQDGQRREYYHRVAVQAAQDPSTETLKALANLSFDKVCTRMRFETLSVLLQVMERAQARHQEDHLVYKLTPKNISPLKVLVEAA